MTASCASGRLERRKRTVLVDYDFRPIQDKRAASSFFATAYEVSPRAAGRRAESDRSQMGGVHLSRRLGETAEIAWTPGLRRCAGTYRPRPSPKKQSPSALSST